MTKSIDPVWPIEQPEDWDEPDTDVEPPDGHEIDGLSDSD